MPIKEHTRDNLLVEWASENESDIVIQALHQAMPAWTLAIKQTEQALHKYGHIKR
jgi:hypothetical protein